MGNQQSNSTESIGFKDTNVNAYSATLPGSFQINQEINAVIDNLPVHNENTLSPPPTKAINPTSNLDLQLGGGGCGDDESSIVSLGLADIFFKNDDVQLGGSYGEDDEKSELENNAISNTSPFISSEMYNFLMKGGGAKKSKRSKKSKKSKKGKKNKKHDTETSLTVDSSPVPGEADDSDDAVDYMSSSAHTGVDSESDDMEQEFKQVSSVNTSDIKLVTEN